MVLAIRLNFLCRYLLWSGETPTVGDGPPDAASCDVVPMVEATAGSVVLIVCDIAVIVVGWEST